MSTLLPTGAVLFAHQVVKAVPYSATLIANPVEAVSYPATVLVEDPISRAAWQIYERRAPRYCFFAAAGVAPLSPSSNSVSPLSVISLHATHVLERVSQAAKILSSQRETRDSFSALKTSSIEEDISEIGSSSSSSSSVPSSHSALKTSSIEEDISEIGSSSSSSSSAPSSHSALKTSSIEEDISEIGSSSSSSSSAPSFHSALKTSSIEEDISEIGSSSSSSSSVPSFQMEMPQSLERVADPDLTHPESHLRMHSVALFPNHSEALPNHPLAQALNEALDDRPELESDAETISDDDIPLAALAALSRKRKCLAEVAEPRKRLRVLPPNTAGVESLVSGAVLKQFIDKRIAFFRKLLSPLQDRYHENCPWLQTSLLKLMCEYSDALLLDDQELDVLISVLKEIKMEKYDERHLIRQCKYKNIHLRFELKKIKARSSQYSMDVLASESFRFTASRKRAGYMQSYLTKLEADPIISDFLRTRNKFLKEAQGVKRAGKPKRLLSEAALRALNSNHS